MNLASRFILLRLNYKEVGFVGEALMYYNIGADSFPPIAQLLVAFNVSVVFAVHVVPWK